MHVIFPKSIVEFILIRGLVVSDDRHDVQFCNISNRTVHGGAVPISIGDLAVTIMNHFAGNVF